VNSLFQDANELRTQAHAATSGRAVNASRSGVFRRQIAPGYSIALCRKILTESDEFIHEIPPFTGQKKVNKDILIVKRAGTRFENFNEMLTSNNTRKDILYFKLHL